MISEGSCDTEDWSNDAEKSACFTGINYILKYIKVENCYFKLQYISNRYSIDEHRDFFKKTC